MIDQNPEIRTQVRELQAMTQKLDQAFMVSEDFSLEASQLQKIRRVAHHRSTRKRWLILMTSFASLMIVFIAVTEQRSGEEQAVAPQVAGTEKPPVFNKEVVPPPETSWEGPIAEAPPTPTDIPPPGAELPEPPWAKPDPTENLVQAETVAPNSRSQLGARAKSKGAQTNSGELLAITDDFGKAERQKAVAAKKFGAPLKIAEGAFGQGLVPDTPQSPAKTVVSTKKEDALVGAESADSAMVPRLSTSGLLSASGGAKPSGTTRASQDIELRVAVDRRLSNIPKAFPPDLLDMLVQNLNGAEECFQTLSAPPRVDMTVEVSVQGHILSINLIPILSNNEAAISCLTKRIERVGTALQPQSKKNETFDVRINLK